MEQQAHPDQHPANADQPPAVEVLSAEKTCDEYAEHAAVNEMKASVRKLLLCIAKVSVSK
jgi:hypothetical protein